MIIGHSEVFFLFCISSFLFFLYFKFLYPMLFFPQILSCYFLLLSPIFLVFKAQHRIFKMVSSPIEIMSP